MGACGNALSDALHGRPFRTPFVNLPYEMFFVQDLAGLVEIPNPLSYALWFMAPLMQFYLIWCAAFWLIRRRFYLEQPATCHQNTLVWLVRLGALVFLTSVAVTAMGLPTRWRLASNAHLICLGCMTYFQRAGLAPKRWLIGAVVTEVSLGVWMGWSRPVAAVVTSGLLVSAVARTFAAGPPLYWITFIGQRTYSVYLTHTFIGGRVNALLSTLAGPHRGALTSTGIWLAAICGSFAFGALFYELVERPMTKHARKLRYSL